MSAPFLMAPYFRRGEETPWGGDRLRALFGKPAPEGRVGESLEVSALPGRESVASSGEFRGMALSDALAAMGEARDFPLLLKLLDARENLSVQVHPDDAYALEHEGKRGKTEAWLVLAAEPGARIAYGVNTPDLARAFEAGEIERAIRWVSVKPGDVYYLPHGMVHALGAGVCVYEIQQSSDVTYRFWDWNRVGADGKPRDLHVSQALAVTRPALALDKLPGATLLREGGSQTYYIADENFELSRLNLAGRMPLPAGRALLITALSPCALIGEGETVAMKPFDTAFVPKTCADASLEGFGGALCAATPDRARLREALGGRAELVAGLVE